MKKENIYVPQTSIQPTGLIIPEKFIFHEDAAHGWLQVPVALLIHLCIDKQITAYSYRKADQAYLEEDQDMGTFVKAFLTFHKVPVGSESYQNFWRTRTETRYAEIAELRSYAHYY